jgi:hypothetical protein
MINYKNGCPGLGSLLEKANEIMNSDPAVNANRFIMELYLHPLQNH